MSKTPATPPPGDKPVGSAPPRPPAWSRWLWLFWLVIILIWIVPALVQTTPQSVLTYSQFTSDVAAHKIKTVDIPSPSSEGANVTVTGTFTDGKDYSAVTPPITPGSPLADSLKSAGVATTYEAPPSSLGGLLIEILIFLVLPFAALFLIFRWMARRTGSSLQGVMGVGRSRAQVFDAERPKTRFSDVAGYDGAKAEISEVVDFLRSPDRYQRAGATAPRGVLMVGPPGTGKTLLARAVAGEASVPFFSVTGSSFVELFVGVGAARVRDLFAEARKAAPAIIFVDEIDAIGQRRGGAGQIVANDEREQTLNQLLSELDGFDPRAGIVVLGATNRPDVLDPALLRPGRFDRQVVIPLPTLDERAAILAVHCRDKKLGLDVDLDVVARGTPGFSGADLANLANEAAIFAVRDGRVVLTAADFDNARDRILLGRREGSNVLLPEEKHAVAVHEAGHALVTALSEHADPVAKVTILPAGQALGVTQQLPLYERHLHGEDYLTQTLAVQLGGRAAELVELGQGSTGAANDLAAATDLATKMVRVYGLSDKLGPIGYPEGGSVFLGDGAGGGGGFSSRPYAEATQANIDAEVARMLRNAEQTAVSLIRAHLAELDRIVALLLEKETVDGAEVYAIVGKPVPERRSQQPLTIAPHGASAVSAPDSTRPRAAGSQEHDGG